MLIAQGSINVDENAKLAYDNAQNVSNSLQADYNQKIQDAKTKYQSLLNGRVTNSKFTPFQVADINQHSNGDLWVQQSDDGNTAINMWYWNGSGWEQQTWDQQVLRVKQLSALNADLGHITAGILESVKLVSSEIHVDIDNNGTGAYDGGYNAASWTANNFNYNDSSTAGFHFSHGLMTFRGYRVSGDFSNTWDNTFLAPNDIKLRNSRSDSNGSTTNNFLNHRLDLRSDSIELSNSYGSPTNGVGSGIYSDGSAVFSSVLYVKKIEAGSPGAKVHFNSGIETPYNIYCDKLMKYSDLSLKNVNEKLDPKVALSEVVGTDIYKYRYKNDPSELNIGPIIDDVNGINNAQYQMSEYMIKRDDTRNVFSMDNAIGLLIGSVKQLSKQNEQLLGKITKLEAQVNGNN